jgi:hypothetical protein
MRPNAVKALREIATVRRLQRIGSEARAAQASLDLRETESALSEKQLAMQNTEENWKNAVMAPRYQFEMVPFWSAALMRNQNVVRGAVDERDAAATWLNQMKTAWSVATIRYEDAEDRARAALRKAVQLRDEKMLQESADRYSLRWYRR